MLSEKTLLSFSIIKTNKEIVPRHKLLHFIKWFILSRSYVLQQVDFVVAMYNAIFSSCLLVLEYNNTTIYTDSALGSQNIYTV